MSSPTTDAVFGIRQVLVIVQDLDRATGFYRDTLGLRYLFTAPPGMAFFECGGVRLMLATNQEASRPLGTSLLYYGVADIHAAAARLRGRGVRFAAEPHVVHRGEDVELWLAEFEDSEGNPAALMSEVRIA